MANVEDINRVAAASNAFALDLHKYLRHQNKEPSNICFSPVSISTAVAMILLGCHGNTATQILKVLGFDGEDDTTIHSSLKRLNEFLSWDTGSRCELVSSNCLFGQKGYSFLQEFLEASQDYYDAALKTLDFVAEAESAREFINEWVESKTKGKIQNLFPFGSIDATTTLVLVSAIYFKGKWVVPFSPGKTSVATFHVSKTKTVPVKMMNERLVSFRILYDQALHCKLLEVPYVGDKLSMVVVLPEDIEGLSTLEGSLTPAVLSKWLSDLQQRPCKRAIVAIPKFKLEADFVLNDALSDVGMSDLFDPKLADLSQMAREKGLVLSQVLHKAFVEVNEEGTEAAAATGGAVRHSMPPQFIANHPFLFMICERNTGTVLFMGSFSKPEQ